MKKFLCLALALIMLVGICGCFDGNGPEDVRRDIGGENQNEPAFSLGKTANNTYNNDFLGISCALPDDWTFYTDEEILEINNIVGDVVDEDIAEQLENANVIYDMYATCQTEGSNMNVNLEKLSSIQTISLDIKQTLESQIDTIKQGYENMGYKDTNVEYKKIKVDSKEFHGLKLTARIQDIDFYATIFTFKKGNYLANVTICSLQTDKTDTILSYFTVK